MGMVFILVNIQWCLTKCTCYLKWWNQTVKVKNIVCDTKTHFFERSHRPILIKKHFLESAQLQLSNGICHVFWAWNNLPTNRTGKVYSIGFYWIKHIAHRAYTYHNAAPARPASFVSRGLSHGENSVPGLPFQYLSFSTVALDPHGWTAGSLFSDTHCFTKCIKLETADFIPLALTWCTRDWYLSNWLYFASSNFSNSHISCHPH